MGLVYYGKWNKTDIAIKQLKTIDQQDEFENEAILMSSLRHPSIVNCYGISLTINNNINNNNININNINNINYLNNNNNNNGKYMIVEYLENGSLEQAIYKSKINLKILKFNIKLNILIDITKGLIYLHNIKPHKIIHRDLKPGNILLNNNMNAKVGDFGLSKIISNNSATMTSNVGTLLYMAPELLSDNHKGKSTKVDIYSFGIIMWELLYEILPYSNEIDKFTTIFQMLLRVANGHRPQELLKEFNEKEIEVFIEHNFTKQEIQKYGTSHILIIIQKYIEIMDKCWNHNPEQRPEFIEIIDLLEDLQLG